MVRLPLIREYSAGPGPESRLVPSFLGTAPGADAFIAWGVSNATSGFRWRAKTIVASLPATRRGVLGRRGTGTVAVVANSSSQLEVWVDGSLALTSTDMFSVGASFSWQVQVTSTSASVTINAGTPATVSGSYTLTTEQRMMAVGGWSCGGNKDALRGIHGSVYDIEFEDLADTTNSGEWRMHRTTWRDYNALRAAGSTAQDCIIVRTLAQTFGASETTAVAATGPYALLDSNGARVWTTANRVVHVATNGNDSNDGLSTGAPKLTVPAALTAATSGGEDFADIALRRGDTFVLTDHIAVKVTGESIARPIRFTSYSDPGAPSTVRPILAMNATDKAIIRMVGSPDTRHVAFHGLHFKGDYSGDPTTVSIINCTALAADEVRSGIWMEDCIVEGGQGFTFDGSTNARERLEDIVVRRCIIARNYDLQGQSAHVQGFFAVDARRVLVEENYFLYSGWLPTTGHTGFEHVDADEPTTFNHAIYSNNGNEDVTIRGNVILRPSSHAIQARNPGAWVEANVAIECPIGPKLAGGDGAAWQKSYGVMRDNFVIAATDIQDGATERREGYELGGFSDGTVTYRNVFANASAGGNANSSKAFFLGTSSTAPEGANQDALLQECISHGSNIARALNVGHDNMFTLSATLYDCHLGNDQPAASTNACVTFGGAADLSGMTLEGVNVWAPGEADADKHFIHGATYGPVSDWDALVASSDGVTENAPSFSDPTRSVATFLTSIGEGTTTTERLIDLCFAKTAANWTTGFTPYSLLNYFRAGFDLPAIQPAWAV